MKPIVKYQGGKTRELPIITSLLPALFSRVVEPFAGGAAVAFKLGKPSVLNDTNKNVIDLYETIASENYYRLHKCISTIKLYDHDQLERLYYKSRDIINSSEPDIYRRAIAYVIVRQLTFSGMERYNRNGEFNVPFGHYKSFACGLSIEHHQFLQQCVLSNTSFETIFDKIKSDDFIFVDPPYLERLGYTTGDGGEELHQQLYECLKVINEPWLLVHSENAFYHKLYAKYNILTKDFVYGQRFGANKNHTGAKTQHLYIRNYD